MSTTLQFHFDFLSPYAYLAWHGIAPIAQRHDAEVVAVPTLLAPLLANGGTKGPAEIPAKRRYVFVDCWRGAHKLGVKLRPPPSHPFNPLTALRAVCAAPDDARSALVTALFAVAWGGDVHPEGGLEEKSVVARVASAVGLDGDAIVAATQTPEIKAVLKSNTSDAIEHGVFGVPTIRVGDGFFWGYDALGYLDDYLAGNDPLPPKLLQQWANLPASAERT